MFLLVALLTGVITAYLSSAVAKDKGHDGTPWFWGGFFFGPLGLIAAAGLSDRKLRRYIRQIGEKQEAIKEELEPNTSKNLRPDGYSIGTFSSAKMQRMMSSGRRFSACLALILQIKQIDQIRT